MRVLVSIIISLVIAFDILPKIHTTEHNTQEKQAPQTQQSETKKPESKHTETKHARIITTKKQSKPEPESKQSVISQPIEVKTNRLNSQLAHLATKAPALKKSVLKLALTAYHKAFRHGDVKKQLLTVIDYSLPSNKQRMWIFDLKQEKLLYNTYVAHGKNSGNNVPHHFSNQPSSKETSLGTYVTRDTYYGSKGFSLNLKGLEHGFNDNAYNRRVVIHGAWYVEPGFIKSTGHAGRSWGCPSIATTLARPIINILKGGSVIFAYYPDKNYLKKSSFVA